MRFSLHLYLVALVSTLSGADAGLRISTEPEAVSGSVHEPIAVQLVVTNVGTTPREVIIRQAWELELRMRLTLPNGGVEDVQAPVWGRGLDVMSSYGKVTLRPGESHRQTLLLNEWFDFDEAGSQAVHIDWPEEHVSTDVSVALGPRDPGLLARIAEGLLKEIQEGERIEAPRRLRFMNDEAVIPVLSRLAGEQLWPYDAGISGLGRIESPESVAALRKILESDRRDAAVSARSALGMMGLETKNPELKQLIDVALNGR
jgi:hypothetical protein